MFSALFLLLCSKLNLSKKELTSAFCSHRYLHFRVFFLIVQNHHWSHSRTIRLWQHGICVKENRLRIEGRNSGPKITVRTWMFLLCAQPALAQKPRLILASALSSISSVPGHSLTICTWHLHCRRNRKKTKLESKDAAAVWPAWVRRKTAFLKKTYVSAGTPS